MLRWIGAGMVTLFCIASGMFAAEKLVQRVRQLEQLLLFFGAIEGELVFTLEEPGEIFFHLQRRSKFDKLPFFKSTCQLMQAGKPFPLAFSQGIMGDASLHSEDRRLLEEWGNVLGSMDLEGQLTQFQILKERVKAQLALAQTECQQHSKLYRTLGVTAGAALFILLV